MSPEQLKVSERIYKNNEGGQYHLTELIEFSAIQNRTKKLGEEITKDYQDKKLILVAPLKGANIFLADLIRYIDNDELEIEFVEASSYGDGTTSQGVTVTRDFKPQTINGRNVLIVEDIVDTGNTLDVLLHSALKLGPPSVKIAALLSKSVRREIIVPIEYLGFEIPDFFVVGAGLDYQQRHRQLQGIYVVEFTG